MEIARMVSAAAGGDNVAWEALVERFSGLVWSVARAHRLDDAAAADVAQTTWLRLVEHLGRLREPERVGAWLAATARHESLRTLRVAQRTVLTGEDIEPGDSVPPGLDAALLADERDTALWHAFGGLGARCQALLRALTADPAPSYEEISAALDMPIGSIGPTRARCLDKLRTLVEPTGITAADGGS
jgi:RNA polymerase sigma factor (sigma-70 family)